MSNLSKYPYYIPVFFDAGILRKIFNEKKFKTWDDAINALKKFINKHKYIEKEQLLILEYTEQYQGKITDIFTNNKFISIVEHIK